MRSVPAWLQGVLSRWVWPSAGEEWSSDQLNTLGIQAYCTHLSKIKPCQGHPELPVRDTPARTKLHAFSRKNSPERILGRRQGGKPQEAVSLLQTTVALVASFCCSYFGTPESPFQGKPWMGHRNQCQSISALSRIAAIHPSLAATAMPVFLEQLIHSLRESAWAIQGLCSPSIKDPCCDCRRLLLITEVQTQRRAAIAASPVTGIQRGSSGGQPADFLSDTREARRQSVDIVKVLQGGKKKPINQESYIQQNCSLNVRQKLRYSQINKSQGTLLTPEISVLQECSRGPLQGGLEGHQTVTQRPTRKRRPPEKHIHRQL